MAVGAWRWYQGSDTVDQLQRCEANYFGADSFTYRVTDGDLESEIATVSLTVTSVNDAPVASDVTVTTQEDNSVTINLIAADADNAPATLAFVIQNAPQNGTLTANADGSYSYAPAANFNGADSFTYTVTDGDLVSNTATVRISVTSVNDAPVAQDLVTSLLEDGYVILNLNSLASDVDGDTLTITPANPVQGSLTREANGSYRYQPAANYNGTDSFSYSVSDGQVSATATVRLNVTAVNDAPVATGDSATVVQGSSVTINVLANDSDMDSPTSSLRPVIITQPAQGNVIVNADGTVTYTPTSTYSGADSFTYATSDGSVQSAPVTVSLTVTPNNRPPVFTSTPPSTITLGAGSGTGGSTTSNDSVFLPVNSNGNSSGQITTNFKLTERNAGYANEVGYYRVDDATGRIGNLKPGDAGYAAAALAASRAVNLFGGDDSVGDNASSKIAAGQHIGFYLIQNSSISNWRSKNSANALPTGSQTQQQKPLAFFSFQAANPDGFDHLQASFASDNANNANGNGKLTLKWEDLTGGGDKDFDDVVFTATGLRAVSTTTTPPVTTTIFTYDADATDADGDTLTYSLGQAPQGATINAQTGLINWTASTAGTYSFSVAASDGKGGSSTQTFTLTVNNAVPQAPANRMPIASNDNATVDEDGTVKINVLANDADADGNTLTANVVTGPQNGSLTKNADGSFQFTPKKDWFGTDSFTYRANDGTGDSALATVTITVKPVNDAPVAQNATYSVNKDGSIKIDLRGLTSDVDDNCLDICVNNPGKGTLTRNSDGTYTYRPRRGYTGADSFSYTVSDGKLSSTGTINLNVGQGTNSGGGSCNPRSASVVVSSSASTATSPSTSSNQIQYVVINSASSVANTTASSANTSSSTSGLPTINWQASSSSSSSASSGSGSNWLAQLLKDSNDERDNLANRTGLKVKL